MNVKRKYIFPIPFFSLKYLKKNKKKFHCSFKEDNFAGEASIEEMKANNRNLRNYIKEVMNVIDRKGMLLFLLFFFYYKIREEGFKV